MPTFTIRGVVREDESGIGLPGLLVQAYDKDRRSDDLLGSTRSRPGGTFEILTSTEDFRDRVEKKPDIYLKVLAPDETAELYSTENAVRRQAGRLEEFEVRIPREALGEIASPHGVRLFDDSGQERADFDVGESLRLSVEGVERWPSQRLRPERCDVWAAGEALPGDARVRPFRVRWAGAARGRAEA